MNNLLIFGYGYTAEVLAKILNSNEWNVIGTSRSKTYDKYCQIINYERSQIEKALETSTHILMSIPPNTGGDIVFQDYKEFIESCKNIKWIGVLSTSSVYGNHDGDWVDENTKTVPTNQRGVNRILAENQWLEFGKEKDIATNIFRLPGIYGPGRNVLAQVKNGTRRSINKEGQIFSRIHVLDIARVVEIAMNKSLKSEVFNVCDDLPCSSVEVNEYAAYLLQVPHPEVVNYEDANLTGIAAEFYKDNKKVRNQKMKDLLGVTLKYPNYKDGLNNCLNPNEVNKEPDSERN